MQLLLGFEPDTRLRTIHRQLLAVHGPQRDVDRYPPITQLFRAMISSRTKDAKSGQAFLRLCKFLSSWHALAEADPKTIAEIISLVQYADRKAHQIVTTARILRSLPAGCDLSCLANWPVDAAMAWLQKLPGVGPKVATATLNFSNLRKRVFVVDTHIRRLAIRLRLVPGHANDRKIFRMLMRLMPEGWDADDLYELHWLMKMHSQEICRHARPLCNECVLADLCPSSRSNSQRIQPFANASHLH